MRNPFPDASLEPLQLTITKAALYLGVSRKALSALLNGQTGISLEMALRLSIATAESWLMQQMHYDLWHARQHTQPLKVEKLWTKKAA